MTKTKWRLCALFEYTRPAHLDFNRYLDRNEKDPEENSRLSRVGVSVPYVANANDVSVVLIS